MSETPFENWFRNEPRLRGVMCSGGPGGTFEGGSGHCKSDEGGHGTFEELLADLRRAGIRVLDVEPDGFSYHDPKNAMTPALTAEIKAHSAAILAAQAVLPGWCEKGLRPVVEPVEALP